MPRTSEPKTLKVRWKTFNLVYGPWHRLMTIDNKAVPGFEVVVQPDMSNQRYFWYVRQGPREKPKRVDNGIAMALDAAQSAAMARFEQLCPSHVKLTR